MVEFPQRKRIRLQEYEYSNDGYYFITICMKKRSEFFGTIINGHIFLSEYGKILEKRWLDLPNHYKNCEKIIKIFFY